MAATADCRRQSKQRRRLGAICAALEPSPLGANSSRRLVTGPATPGEGFATMDLSGRVALVTGGGQGLGGTIALAMARAGADVVLSYSTSGDRAMAIGEEILGMGRRAVAFQADVGDTAQCTALAEKAEKAYGQIDILISNAGMGQGNGVVNTTDDEWDRTMNVNARATFALARCLLPGMVSRKFGRIVTISSNVGVYGRGGASGIAYAASKAALIAVTKGIAHEGAPHITANAILPGPTAREHPSEREGPVEVVEGTEENALGFNNPATSWLGRYWLSGRQGIPEDVAHACAFFATPAASLITGQVLHVSGGMMMDG